MIAATARLQPGVAVPFSIRVGLHSGPVMAGVIGTRKFAYDVWGDTVNIAARIEPLASRTGAGIRRDGKNARRRLQDGWSA